MELSRRDWLTTSWLLAVWPEVAAAQEHAHQAVKSSPPPAFVFLDTATAREIAALAECILPSDETPGAKEAGVIYFIDRALITFAIDQQGVYRDGLLSAQAKRKELFPESESIAGLSEAQQIELLKSQEGSAFFQTLRFHTLAGFLAEPSYGGNRDGTGWKLIGFDNNMTHEPPFGYYDREAKEERAAMMQAKYAASEAVDFVVVGSGAAGGVVAKELATAGFKVVVLEQGPYLREKDFTHDELRFNFQRALTNDPEKQPNTFRRTEADEAKVQRSVGYGRQVGGGSVHYAGNYWRFHESDFKERTLWGEIPGTGLADWPITYDELEPYYTKAEWDIGISGLGGANPFESWRSKPYPLPPLPVKSSGVLFERGAKKLGLHPYPAPMAVISQPFRGRGACVHCGFCARFGCEMRAKSSSLATVIPDAVRTGKCEIRADSYVRRIQTDDKGRVTGAVYFDRDRNEVFQKAKAVVVCANGAESPRLLLMSKSNRFPDGLANSSGLVGKYLMFDTGTTAEAVFEHPLNDFKSVEVTRALHDFYAADPKRGFYGGGGMDARFNYNPISFAMRGMPRDLPQWGHEYKKNLAEYFSRTMASMSHTTCLPQEQNSISLDPAVKDAWGLPAMRVTFKLHADDVSTMKFILARQLEVLEAAGARRTWTNGVRDVSGSVHLMGTCRMGNDPKQSVVDKYHQAHDVPNLFVVDGSSFVTSGRQQPTCTIQALAYRAADYIAKTAKAGAI